jgi:D-threo-aldose 1-dehydrogenase
VDDRALPNGELRFSKLGLGAAGLGNLYRETSDADSDAAVAEAWARGIRYFDTAPHYGLGLSERRLGRALAKYPRDEYVISTKVGRLLVANDHPIGMDSEGFAVPDDLVREWDFSRDGIRRSLDASLERLGLDRVDIVYAHDPDQAYPGAGIQAAPFLAELRDEGLATSVGVGTNSGHEAAKLLAETDLDLAMLAGRYTLAEQDALDDALAVALDVGKRIVSVGVFNTGLLSTDRPSTDARYEYQAADPALIARVNAIADICSHFDVTVPQAAVAFPLLHPAVVNVTLGMRTAAQVRQNAALVDVSIPSELWAELMSAGLLRSDAPTQLR